MDSQGQAIHKELRETQHFSLIQKLKLHEILFYLKVLLLYLNILFSFLLIIHKVFKIIILSICVYLCCMYTVMDINMLWHICGHQTVTLGNWSFLIMGSRPQIQVFRLVLQTFLPAKSSLQDASCKILKGTEVFVYFKEIAECKGIHWL